MKKLGLMVYLIAGAALIVSGFATTERGLKENNKLQLEKVAKDYEELSDMGFEGFCPTDYRIAFSDGEKEIVTSYNNGDYETYEREAVYGGLVGSIYQNGDEFEVIVPEYDTWASISAVSGQQLSYVIWHESFHAYQNTYFNVLENTEGLLTETQLSEQVDTDPELKNSFTRKLETLKKVTNAENTGDIRKIAIEYIDIVRERDHLLSESQKKSEVFYEMIEGSAYYVESGVALHESGRKAYEKEYLENVANYVDGGAKYYHLGMLECMLLDKLDPDWKASYSFDRALEDVIAEYIGY